VIQFVLNGAEHVTFLLENDTYKIEKVNAPEWNQIVCGSFENMNSFLFIRYKEKYVQF
jgi:hypothetical protein